MTAAYRDLELRTEDSALEVSIVVENKSRQTWTPENFSLGWQFYDPQSGVFIEEGRWTPVSTDVAPGETAQFNLVIPILPDSGGYEVYLSPIQSSGWAYDRGERFVRLGVESAGGRLRVLENEITTVRSLRWRRIRSAVPRLIAAPIRAIAQNHRLIRSMARRDILARYRGSFGDVFWTVLNPLLLMATYFFVFGIVLRRPDQSRTAFALYFLAGMLPWLAFSEPVGRAPFVIMEHRNFVKKLVFPLDTLPVNQVVSGLVTELFGAAIFIAALLIIRHSVPAAVLWLPVLLVPQLMFTLGICWFLAALGVYVRDLGQIMALVLTIWFFVTPICYPEASTLSPTILALTHQNPLYVLVRGYRDVFLDGHAPQLVPLLKLWAVALALFFLGHIWFNRLRKNFPDVI